LGAVRVRAALIARVVVAVGLVVVGPGCRPEPRLASPAGTAAQSVLLAEVDGADPRGVKVTAYEPPDAAPLSAPLRNSADASLVLLTYDRPLAALGISAGPVAFADDGRPLPFQQGFEVVGGRASAAWSPLAALAPPLSQFLYSARPELCLAQGGCFPNGGDCNLSCGGATPTAPAAPEPVAPPAAVTDPAAPIPPAPPAFGACPAGWSPLDRDGVSTCEPNAAGLDCPSGEVAFLGDSACAPLGDPCPPPGEWSSALVPGAGTVIYVRQGASVTGANGTPAAPYPSIAIALSAPQVGPGVVIAIAAGNYIDPLQLPVGVTLWGACARDTALGALSPFSSDDVLRDLRVELPPGAGLVSSNPIALNGVLVEGGGIGLFLRGGSGVRLDHVMFHDSAQDAVHLEDGASLEAAGLILEPSGGAGLSVGFDATATVSDLWIRDAAPGLLVQSGARLTVQRALIEQSRGAAISVVGGALLGSDLIARDTALDRTVIALPAGIELDGDGMLQLQRLVLERNPAFGLSVIGASTASVSDLVDRDVSVDEDGGDGLGVIAAGSARLFLARALVVRVRDIGVYVSSSTGALSDLAVRDITPDDQRHNGSGILFDSGASGSITRAAVAHTQHAGVALWGVATRATIADLSVVDTSTAAFDAGFGPGLWLDGPPNVSLARVLVERAMGWGLLGDGASAPLLRLADVTVHDVRPIPNGDGIGIELVGVSATLDRAHVEGAAFSGLQLQTGTSVQATDLFVRGVVGDQEAAGVNIVDSAATITRAHLSAVGREGIIVGTSVTSAPPANLILADAWIEDPGFIGLRALSGAMVAASRLKIERAVGAGVDLRGIEARIEDLAVLGVASSTSAAVGVDVASAAAFNLARADVEDIAGAGLLVQNGLLDPSAANQLDDLIVRRARLGVRNVGTAIKGQRWLLEDNVDSGLEMALTQGDVRLSDLVVRGVQRAATDSGQACTHAACARAGLWLDGQVSLDARRLLLDDDGYGIALLHGAQADLHEGVISHNDAGASIRSDDGFAFRRLADQVVFRSNTATLEVEP
jgi:hypothetical protein